ncbi:Aste57867_10082 [Aphanomyces stellatus]|uniref:Aste57867_10082 protein n=1 Tax=Aphanomyces stellatus TaxID=120398 RepID=A0A485KQ44_9STRA|nr:hypothetical protein As57867_010043 [Aphanomyces stellatus]VFT86958.1 Aste57867_10082 [Aphanomyces stellatus]
MADAVQYMMEKMIPELEDLQHLKIFSKEEVRQIVQKRRDFEYTMKRTPLRKVDCLRYIEYELNLDALRRQRKKRMGLKKSTLSDHTGISRVHNIFDRALLKHRGDVDLWLQHIAFCKNQGSTKILSLLFTHALQVHPRNEALWIEAASWEFATNLNVDSARVLMQRSIRINPHSQKLWLEYFRLELLYVQKLRARREVLGLDDKKALPKELSLDIAPVEGEEDDASKAADAVADATSAVEDSRREILLGAIPKIVFHNAVQAIPSDAAFRLAFLDITNLFPSAYAKPVADAILASATMEFPTDAAVWAAFCDQAMHDDAESDDVDSRRKVAIERFHTALVNLATDAMREAFLHWCVSELARTPASPWFTTQMEQTMNALGPLSPVLHFVWVDYTLRAHGLQAAVAKAHKATSAFPTDAKLWLFRAQLVMRLASVQAQDVAPPATKRAKKPTQTSVFTAALVVVEEGLKHTAKQGNNGDAALLWQRYLQLLMSKPASTTAIRAAFQKALKAATAWTPSWSTLRQQYLRWTHRALGLAATRTLYKTFLAGQMLPNEDTLAFLRWTVQVEAAEPDSAAQRTTVQGLFEKIVDLYGEDNEDVWVEYIQFYRERGLHKEANDVHWRSTRTFPSSTLLANLHELP